MEMTTLSSKGQLVIPKGVREQAQVSAGARFEVRYLEGEIRLRVVPDEGATTLDNVSGCLAKPNRQRLSDTQTRAIIIQRIKASNAP